MTTPKQKVTLTWSDGSTTITTGRSLTEEAAKEWLSLREGNAPRKYWLNLLRAARLVEAHSHYNKAANDYRVDPHAMAHLCAAAGNRKLSSLKA